VVGFFLTAPHPPSLSRAEILLDTYPLIDGHNDVPWTYRRASENSVLQIDFSKNIPNWQTDLPRLISGKVGGQFWSVYVPCEFQGKDAVRATLEQIDVVKKMVRAYPILASAYTVNDIQNNFAANKISSLIGIEGSHSIDGSLAALRMMYELGARYMTLTHNCNNVVADSCYNNCAGDPDCRNGTCVGGICTAEQTQGVSAFGEIVLLEMNRLGMLIDISHVSVPAMKRALQISKAPVIFSHSNAKALCGNVRNVPSDVLVQLQVNRGVIMLSFLSDFLNCSQNSSASQVIDHIRYIATGNCPAWKTDCNAGFNFSGIGFDYIGLGSDFDGATNFPPDLNSVADFVHLTNLMLNEFSQESVEKIIGGNIIRVMREVETVAQNLNSFTFPNETMIFPQRACRSTY
jgi:membrane dipeptidase